MTDPAGRVTTYSYDLLNRLLKERAPGDSVTYVPSARGLYQVRDAAGKVYTFNRNLLGWVESEADAQGRTTSYRYDAGGCWKPQTISWRTAERNCPSGGRRGRDARRRSSSHFAFGSGLTATVTAHSRKLWTV